MDWSQAGVWVEMGGALASPPLPHLQPGACRELLTGEVPTVKSTPWPWHMAWL